MKKIIDAIRAFLFGRCLCGSTYFEYIKGWKKRTCKKCKKTMSY